MRAAWYERQGPASEVLEVGQLRMPNPAAGEVWVALALSGVNPSKHGTSNADPFTVHVTISQLRRSSETRR